MQPIDRRSKFTINDREENKILNETVGTYLSLLFNSSNLLGSAFSAKKQLASEPVSATPGKHAVTTENEDEEIEEKGSVDELSDEDIDFVNSFEALRESAPSVIPSKKKLKKKASLNQLVL